MDMEEVKAWIIPPDFDHRNIFHRFPGSDFIKVSRSVAGAFSGVISVADNTDFDCKKKTDFDCKKKTDFD